MTEPLQGDTSVLVIVFRQRPTIAVLPHYPENGFRCGDLILKDIGGGDCTGFYDWLRSADGRLTGVRYCAAIDYASCPFHEELPQLPYVRKTPGFNCLDIFFGSGRTYSDPISNDQDWEDNGLFQASDGTYAITVALSRLAGNERASLDQFIRDVKAEMI